MLNFSESVFTMPACCVICRGKNAPFRFPTLESSLQEWMTKLINSTIPYPTYMFVPSVPSRFLCGPTVSHDHTYSNLNKDPLTDDLCMWMNLCPLLLYLFPILLALLYGCTDTGVSAWKNCLNSSSSFQRRPSSNWERSSSVQQMASSNRESSSSSQQRSSSNRESSSSSQQSSSSGSSYSGKAN